MKLKESKISIVIFILLLIWIVWLAINWSNRRAEQMYKTLTLEGVIDFLATNFREVSITTRNLWVITYTINVEIPYWVLNLTEDSKKEAIEKLLEYLLDNNLLK